MAKLPVSIPLKPDPPSLQALTVELLQMYQLISKTFNNPDAGATSTRPNAGLVIGQTFFDTTLDRPIWWNGTAWINASGTPV